MNKWGNRSREVLKELHPDLQLILNVGLPMCPVDFGLHEGHRSYETQLRYFLSGKSRIDPRRPEMRSKAKHLKYPSEAVDFHVSERSATWHTESLSFVAGYLFRVAQRLYAQGDTSHLLRWGGDWDRDGEIMVDQSFNDLPHLELYKP